MSLPANMSRGNSGMGSFYPSGSGLTQPPGAASYSGRVASCNGQLYSSLTSRHSHPSVAHTYNYAGLDDNTFEHYAQAPHYLLPAQDLQPSMSSTYTAQDMSRQWTPMASNRQAVNGTDDPQFKYGTSGFPYLNSSAVASVGPDGFGMNSLGRALPRGDRILPNPRRTSTAPSTDSYQKSGESVSYGLPPGLSHKSSAAWSPQTLNHGAIQGSISSSSLSALSGPLNSLSPSPQMESSQNTTAFGYVPLSSSPLHQSISMSRAPEINTINNAADNRSRLTDVPYSKSRTILPMRSSSSLYGWDTGSGTKADPITDTLVSEPTLVNGQKYTRIRQQPIQHNPGDPLPVERPSSIVPTQQSTAVATHSRQR